MWQFSQLTDTLIVWVGVMIMKVCIHDILLIFIKLNVIVIESDRGGSQGGLAEYDATYDSY